ncbi:MAG: hypothetical protein OH318_02605 [Candidatus Parvarchaeota archaeon]|nr:hypothetical protein [Candidatus Rehaiarchaeum fermentans]
MNWRKLGFKEEEIEEARRFAELCYTDKRWNGNPVLIILDACFDSIGLNYFSVVFRKTYKFYLEKIKTGKVINCKDLLTEQNLEYVRSLLNNDRVVNCIKKICEIVSKNENEYKFLKEWAFRADPYKFKEDIIGKINGVGINTFQYLRMQVGVDTIMPDKIIINWLKERAGLKINNPFDAIEKGHKFASSIGLKDTELCWAIWISESNEFNKIIIM